MHAGIAGIDDARAHLDQMTYVNRLDETNAAHIHRHAILPAPPHRAGVTGLIDPFHYGAAVDLTAKIDFRWLGQEPQGYFTLLVCRWHGKLRRRLDSNVCRKQERRHKASV